MALLILPQTNLIGDEPYFLLISTSLLKDFDANLENNYLDGDSLAFMDHKIKPQQWDTYVDGRLVSRHSTLFPLILLPFFLLGGRIGSVFIVNIISALLGVFIYKISFFLTQSNKDSLLGTISILLFLPILTYSSALYTETLGALLGTVTLYIVLKMTDKNRYFSLFNLGLIFFFSAWLKTRFLFLTVPIFLTHLVLNLKKEKLLMALFVIAIAISIVSLINIFIYGEILGRYTVTDIMGFNIHRFLKGVVGQIWDAQYGIIPLNPLSIFSIAGLIFLFNNRTSRLTILLLMAVLPYYMVVSAYAELIGGICPRGRFLIGCLPVNLY